MKREQPQSGGPAPDSNHDLVHTPRPAPGKVTPASRLPGGEGAAVQRKPAEPRPASGSEPRSSSRLADVPGTDVAHRGLAAVAESGPATGAVVQREEGEPARRAGDAIPAELRTRLMERLRASAEMQSVFAEIRTGRGNLDFAVKWSRAPTGLKQEASCGLTIPLVSALDDFQILDGGRSPHGEEILARAKIACAVTLPLSEMREFMLDSDALS